MRSYAGAAAAAVCCSALAAQAQAQTSAALLRQVQTVQVRRPAGAVGPAYRVTPRAGVRTIGPAEAASRDTAVSLSFVIPEHLPAGRQPIADVEWGGARVTVFVRIAERRALALRPLEVRRGPRGADTVVAWLVNCGNVTDTAAISHFAPPGVRMEGPQAATAAPGDSVRLAFRVRGRPAAATPAAFHLRLQTRSGELRGDVALARAAAAPEPRAGLLPVGVTVAMSERSTATRIDARFPLGRGVSAELVAGQRIAPEVGSALRLPFERGLSVTGKGWSGRAGELTLWTPLMPSGGVAGQGALLTVRRADAGRLEVAVARAQDPTSGAYRSGVAAMLHGERVIGGVETGVSAVAAPGIAGQREAAAALHAEDAAGPLRWRALAGIDAGAGPVGELAVRGEARQLSVRAAASRLPRGGGATAERVDIAGDVLLSRALRVFGYAYRSEWGTPPLPGAARTLDAGGRDDRAQLGARFSQGSLHALLAGGVRTSRWGAAPERTGAEGMTSLDWRFWTLATLGAAHERVWDGTTMSPYTRLWLTRFVGTTIWSLQAETGSPAFFAGPVGDRWRYSACGETSRARVTLAGCASGRDGQVVLGGSAVLRASVGADLVVALEPWDAAARSEAVGSRLLIAMRARGAPALFGGARWGTVYDDRNGNGRRDPGEAAVPGVTILRGAARAVTDGRGRYRAEGEGPVRAALEEFEAGWMPGLVRGADVAIHRAARVRVDVRFTGAPADAAELHPAGAVRVTGPGGLTLDVPLDAGGTAQLPPLGPGAYRLEHLPPSTPRHLTGASPASLIVQGGDTRVVDLNAAYHPRRIVQTLGSLAPRAEVHAPPVQRGAPRESPVGDGADGSPPLGTPPTAVRCSEGSKTVRAGMSEIDVVCALGRPAFARRRGAWTFLHYTPGPTPAGTDIVWLRNGRVVAALLRAPGRAWEGADAHTALKQFQQELYETESSRR